MVEIISTLYITYYSSELFDDSTDMTGCNWTEGKGCTKKRQHKRNGFCQFHYNIWFRRQRINNNETLTNTATGGDGAQVINNGTVGLTENRLLSVTGENDESRVARSNTATGGDTLPISNKRVARLTIA